MKEMIIFSIPLHCMAWHDGMIEVTGNVLKL